MRVSSKKAVKVGDLGIIKDYIDQEVLKSVTTAETKATEVAEQHVEQYTDQYFAQHAETVKSEANAYTDTRCEVLANQVLGYREELGEVEDKVGSLSEDVSELQGKMATAETDITEIKESMTTLYRHRITWEYNGVCIVRIDPDSDSSYICGSYDLNGGEEDPQFYVYLTCEFLSHDCTNKYTSMESFLCQNKSGRFQSLQEDIPPFNAFGWINYKADSIAQQWISAYLVFPRIVNLHNSANGHEEDKPVTCLMLFGRNIEPTNSVIDFLIMPKINIDSTDDRIKKNDFTHLIYDMDGNVI